jgi:hypothetical protein
MTGQNPIIDLLAAPLSSDWTVEALAEQLLGTIAAQRAGELKEIVLDPDMATDRQSYRLLRPLLACLATKSAAEAGTSSNLYGGRLSFKRPGPDGPVWILGQFENRPGMVRVTFRRSASPPENPETKIAQTPVVLDSLSLQGPPPTGEAKPRVQLAERTLPDRSVLEDKRRRAQAWAIRAAQTAQANSMKPATSSAPGVILDRELKTMCYEIGRIYRDDWSKSQAEKLAATVPILIKYDIQPRFRSGPQVGSSIPVVGPLIAAIARVVAFARSMFRPSPTVVDIFPYRTVEDFLIAASGLIIIHFESEQ